jgi:hypothetical protein
MPYASLTVQMAFHELSIPVCALSLLCFGIHFEASAGELPGVPLPENARIVLAVVGEGVQIYESKLNSNGGYQWALRAPEAELKSLAGDVLGKHFAGPGWSLNDGSQLVGILPPLQAVSSPETGNIPWLLVAPKSRSETGVLSHIDFVARIATSGGIAPAEAPKNPTDIARVNYRAIYLFLQKQ